MGPISAILFGRDDTVILAAPILAAPILAAPILAAPASGWVPR
jgi:hypothetical protein